MREEENVMDQPRHIKEVQCVENPMPFVARVSVVESFPERQLCTLSGHSIRGCLSRSSMYGGSVSASIHVRGLCFECLGHHVGDWKKMLVYRLRTVKTSSTYQARQSLFPTS